MRIEDLLKCVEDACTKFNEKKFGDTLYIISRVELNKCLDSYLPSTGTSLQNRVLIRKPKKLIVYVLNHLFEKLNIDVVIKFGGASGKRRLIFMKILNNPRYVDVFREIRSHIKVYYQAEEYLARLLLGALFEDVLRSVEKKTRDLCINERLFVKNFVSQVFSRCVVNALISKFNSDDLLNEAISHAVEYTKMLPNDEVREVMTTSLIDIARGVYRGVSGEEIVDKILTLLEAFRSRPGKLYESYEETLMDMLISNFDKVIRKVIAFTRLELEDVNLRKSISTGGVEDEGEEEL